MHHFGAISPKLFSFVQFFNTAGCVSLTQQGDWQGRDRRLRVWAGDGTRWGTCACVLLTTQLGASKAVNRVPLI